VPDEDGDYHVEHRLHDVGTALGRSPVLLRGPRDILNFPMTKNKPEEYDRNYVWADKKENVSFIWNDYWHHIRDHAGATYADFKWMARLISSLTREEITEAVVLSGIPADLVGPYVAHITNMRNRAARAFGLEHGGKSVPGRGPVQVDEAKFPTDLIRPDGYQVIKNGKIVGNYYPGSTILPLLQQTWFTKINSFLSGRSFGRDIGSLYHVEGSFGPIARLDTQVGRTLWTRDDPLTMTTFSVGIGINATVARIVEPNRLYAGAEGRSRAYVVRDTLAFSLGIGAPAVSSALARLGPELSISAQLYKRRFQHIHFAESVSAGFRSAVHVHKIIRLGSIERLAVGILTPGDVLREYRAIGATAAAHAGVGFTAPYVGVASVGVVSLSLEAGQTNWETVTYTKDQLGSLHLLLENDYERTLGAQTEQANVTAPSVVNAAAFALGAHRNHLKYDVWNIEVAPKAYDMERATDGVARSGPNADKMVEVLKALRRHPQLSHPDNRGKNALIPDNVKLRFHVQARKQEQRSNAQLLYLLNHDRKKEKSDVSVETDDYEYRFFSKSRAKRGYMGIEHTILDFDTNNSVMREGTSKRLTVEMDRSNPRGLVVWIDVFDYHRSLRRKSLLKLLNKLNQRYKNPDDEDDFFMEPPVATQDPYKRIYANARIYVNGDKLINLVQNSDPKTLVEELQSTNRKPMGWRLKRKIKKAFKEMNKACEALNGLMDDEDNEKLVRATQNRLAEASLHLVNTLYQSNKWGVSYLHKLVGGNDRGGMLVVGEIFGVHDRTNMLQDPDWVSRLRYAGKSWGKLTNVPPVSRFVRVDQPTPANEHAMLDIPLERFLGTVVTGYSGGWVGLGKR